MKAVHSRVARSWLLSAALLLAACGGDSTTAPGRDPEIINNVDNFQYQISDVQSFTGSQLYTWQNTGTAATVNQSSAITGGAVTLVIRDANGDEVYNSSLAPDGTFSTGAGVAGNWTIRVTYASGSGTVNFRVDKAT
jgi:hypothetical protein